ncbi:amidohydrolase [Dendrosporobacter quercicolus]|uniref:Amidohydrolase n=1 Tax=Dendrosporobacter quercicolus TaxID=146817 RepID=A0A1G9XG35_9FIRM|nr:M20 family metallopeptidase [Dendrosporobacter quercicolus]SDM95704.1 amidohydrolase [Dendrosporobacter quercicolus]
MMENLNQKIKALTDKIYDKLVVLRHTIHANPELSNQEYQTADLVEKILTAWKIHYTRLPASTAIIAEIKGNRPGGGSIGIRADMDALPIQEATGLDYASKNQGVMHACGHDMHTANLLGTGYVLSRLKDDFAGTVKLVFQPAEEIGGGAQEILDFGVLENPKVTAFLAAHVSEDVQTGQIQVKAEEVMLASSQFTIHLNGRGGHASAPHQTDDIILAAAKIIIELQTIPGRKLNHLEPAVITVGSIHGGSRCNIIPKELVLTGTIRTQNNHLHQEIHQHITSILNAHELITGVKGTASFRFGSGAVYNDPALTKEFVAAAASMIGPANVVTAKFPGNGSENFYRFSKEVPAVFFRIGVNPQPSENIEPAHSPKFTADDKALKTGVNVTAAAAIAYLQKAGAAV